MSDLSGDDAAAVAVEMAADTEIIDPPGADDDSDEPAAPAVPGALLDGLNGEVPLPPHLAAALDAASDDAGVLLVDPERLTMGDLRRAREKLGVDPIMLLGGDWIDSRAITMWCLLSRHDETLTLADVDRVPFGKLRYPQVASPPQTRRPASSGSRVSRRGGRG
jgi:hypothetical protein